MTGVMRQRYVRAARRGNKTGSVSRQRREPCPRRPLVARLSWASPVQLHRVPGPPEESVSKGDVHTVPHGTGWANKVEGNSRVSNTAPTKSAAQKRGREMAIKARVEHHIHKKDGTIGQRN